MELSTQTHFSQGWNTRLLEDVKGLGTNTIRDSVPWHRVETKSGKYSFDSKYVDWVDDALDAGMNVVLVFSPTNKLYDNGTTVHTAKGLAAFGEFVAATLKAFPGVSTIEIGNEFNGQNFVSGTVANASKDKRDDYYKKIVEAVDDALNDAGIDVKVLGASTHSIPVGYIDKLDENGTLDFLDGVSIHPYTTDAEQFADQLGILRDAIGDKIEIHVTEFGDEFTTLAEAPAYLAKMVSVMAAADVASASWYAFAKQSYFPNMELWDTPSDKATPAGVTFALLENMLADGAQVEQIEVDAYTYFYSFGPNAAILWGEARDVELADGVTAYDLAGNRIKNFDDLSPDEPVILRSNGTISADSVTFGESGLLADSFHDFDVKNAPGSLAGFEGPWSYFAENGKGKTKSLYTMEGDIGGGQPWTPYLGTDFLKPLQIGAKSVTPADFSAKSKPGSEWSVVERYTAEKNGTVSIQGHWDVSDNSKDGVLLTIEVNDRAIFSKVIYDQKNGHEFDLKLGGIVLKAGDTIDFMIGSNKQGGGDVTTRRIQIFEEGSAPTPPVDDSGVPDDADDSGNQGDPGEESNPFDESNASGNVGVKGGNSDDTIVGGTGDDKLYGKGGADKIFGGKGDDRIYADAQDLTIDGGKGFDLLFVSGRGDFSIDLAAANIEGANGARGDDFLDGSQLNSATTLDGKGGADVLLGGSGDDKLYGGKGADELIGGSGNDKLLGGKGNDVLDGGADNDTLTGGGGFDIFRFTGTFGDDVITDFGKGDVIDLSGITGVNDFSDLSITYLRKKAVIEIGDSTITLQRIAPDSLDADDFLF